VCTERPDGCQRARRETNLLAPRPPDS